MEQKIKPDSQKASKLYIDYLHEKFSEQKASKENCNIKKNCIMKNVENKSYV